VDQMDHLAHLVSKDQLDHLDHLVQEEILAQMDKPELEVLKVTEVQAEKMDWLAAKEKKV